VNSPEGTLMHVFAIKEDSKGNIWFGDRDTGAWRFDGKEIKNFKLDSNISTQHIWDIFEDKRGNLLFASGERGVYKFNGNGFDRVF
ncbi:MAG TPA: diguanylate cyclase, partial [Chitinophagaceae bacterium]|nr:diguanylate cyclase [Chitinophagaceae bacterium]